MYHTRIWIRISDLTNIVVILPCFLITQTLSPFPQWMNWMILRTTVVLPLQYLLQVNTFMFYFFGWNCCARCVMGGGPGGQTPYRIYIDSGVVFMCNVALSFAAPLIAPCALIYFCLCIPLWRR